MKYLAVFVAVLLTAGLVVAAPAEQNGLPSVLERIAGQLDALLSRNQSVTVTTGPVNVSVQPLVNVSVVGGPVNVTIPPASCPSLPRRGLHYFESPLTDGNTTVVLPLPNGNCTVVTNVAVPFAGRGRIEAFDGFVASQSLSCPMNAFTCTHRLMISDAMPFARVTVFNTLSYPAFTISYACT